MYSRTTRIQLWIFAIVTLVAVFYVIVNLAVDIAYTVIDPRLVRA